MRISCLSFLVLVPTVSGLDFRSFLRGAGLRAGCGDDADGSTPATPPPTPSPTSPPTNKPDRTSPLPGAPPTFPVIAEFLYSGYDLLNGNPNPTGATGDPGFQQPIFTATYNREATTADNRYSIPDGMFVNQCNNCDLTYSSKVMSSLEEYHDKLSVSVKVSGGGGIGPFKGSFSASTDFETTKDQLFTSSSSVVHSEATCCVYNSGLLTSDLPKFSQNFLNALKALPNEFDQDAYGKFFNAFGTHFVTQASMGAVFGEQSFLSETSRETIEKTSLSVEASASISAAFGASGEASGGVVKDSEARRVFQENVENRNLYTRGSRPPLDNNQLTWANSVFESPAPIEIELERIDALNLPVNSAVMANLKTSIDNFCAMHASNVGAQEDVCETLFDLSFSGFPPLTSNLTTETFLKLFGPWISAGVQFSSSNYGMLFHWCLTEWIICRCYRCRQN